MEEISVHDRDDDDVDGDDIGVYNSDKDRYISACFTAQAMFSIPVDTCLRYKNVTPFPHHATTI